MENQEEKQADVILMGAKEIEKQLHRSYLVLMDLKTGYGFPLKRTGGQPSVDLRELAEWVAEWGQGWSFEKITTEVLHARKNRLNLLAMPETPLKSISEIAEFTSCELHEILNWVKLGVGCPIKIDDETGGISVDGKKLRSWMFDQGIWAGPRENHGLDAY
jgi:hypothetical protein